MCQPSSVPKLGFIGTIILSVQAFSPNFMSSTPTLPSGFQSVFDAALYNYSKQTGIDLATYPYDLQNCQSADDLFNVLQDRAKQFQAYRDGNRKLINCLKPVVQILHTVSGILGDATAPVSPTLRCDPHLV